MRSKLAVVVVAVAVLLALGTATVALAQGPVGDGNGPACTSYGAARGGLGLMHDDMIAAVASRLDLTVEALQVRIDAGETVWQIAREQGLSDDEIVTLMQDAREEALAAAVADGDITQEQADRMTEMRRGLGSGTDLGSAGRGLRQGLGCRGQGFGQSR